MTVLRGAGPVDEPDGTHRADGTGSGYDTRWLDLRSAADDRSRSAELLRLLLDRLGRTGRDRRAGPAAGGPLHLLDAGSGTGAMARWCDARLPAPARWTLLDPDPALLAVARARSRTPPGCLQGRVADLDLGTLAPVDAVVCSALLDVLTADEVRHLVDVVAGADVPLLAALTVTGEVALGPAHADDPRAAAAVHRTATAGGAAGPAALPVLEAAAAAAGLVATRRRSPWRLRAGPGPDGDLVRAWVAGHAAAARAAEPGLDAWAADRLAAAEAGPLAVTVEHVDVLVHRP